MLLQDTITTPNVASIRFNGIECNRSQDEQVIIEAERAMENAVVSPLKQTNQSYGDNNQVQPDVDEVGSHGASEAKENDDELIVIQDSQPASASTSTRVALEFPESPVTQHIRNEDLEGQYDTRDRENGEATVERDAAYSGSNTPQETPSSTLHVLEMNPNTSPENVNEETSHISHVQPTGTEICDTEQQAQALPSQSEVGSTEHLMNTSAPVSSLAQSETAEPIVVRDGPAQHLLNDTQAESATEELDTRTDQAINTADTGSKEDGYEPDVQPSTKSTEATQPIAARPDTKKLTPMLQRTMYNGVNVVGQTMVGGMLASKKAMKPFRSPIIARKDASALSAEKISTPTKTASSSFSTRRPSLLAQSAVHADSDGTSHPEASSSSIHRMSTTNFAISNVALNKPFKSLLAKRPNSTSQVDGRSVGEESSSIGATVSMTSLQLSAALPKLERRLALLRDAKRHLQAQERDLDNADNTDHIRELSAKWLEKGREAAEMLWELVKDTMQNGVNGNDDHPFRSEQDSGYNNWGWEDTSAERRQRGASTSKNAYNARPNPGWLHDKVDRYKQAIQDEIEALDDDDRKELYDTIEAEGSLPEIDPAKIVPTRKRKRLLDDQGDTRDGPSSRSIALPGYATSDDEDMIGVDDHQEDEHDHSIDNDALSPTSHDGHSQIEEEEANTVPDASEDPRNRGMAKMLIQCGIE